MRFALWVGFAAVGFGALVGRGAPREAFPGTDEKWECYQSPRFELFSRVSDKESRELLHNLELLHASFAATVKLPEKKPMLVSVYYFGREKDFEHYVPANLREGDGVAGYYTRRPDRGVIVVSPGWRGPEARRLIFHEYVHHLTRLGGDNPPMWYTEGIAELFSTIDDLRGKLVFGKPLEEHVVYLRQTQLMPFASLFSAGHGPSIYKEQRRERRLLYAQSWAFMHYWYCGDLKLTPEQQKLRADFFNYVRVEGAEGDPAVRAALFERASGMDYTEMARRLEKYVRTGSYRWFQLPLPEIADRATYSVRAMSRGEIALRLAELDLTANRSPSARLALLNAIDERPEDFRVLEALGMDAWFEGDKRMAQERWDRAVALGTKNPGVLHEVAVMEDEKWFSRFDPYFELPDAAAERLRRLLKASIESSPNQTRAYEILAWVEATARRPKLANANLVQAQLPRLEFRTRTMVALALLRVKLKDYATARLILDQVDKDTTMPAAVDSSRVLRALMATGESAGR